MEKYRNNKGKVYLVGAGPGDPGLITMKGLRCIKKADVIIYDNLIPTSILDHASSSSELIFAGKMGEKHTFPQKEINDLMLDRAKAGKIVLRVKGGDPFIFGRGGEEVEVLAEENVEFEVVSGVNSAIASAAYAGIPLTHRSYAADVTFITGHEDPTKRKSNINWAALGKASGTLVFFMGVKNIAIIVNKLTINGKQKKTPVAVVRWGTTAKQVTVVGTLDTIVQKCRTASIKAPAIIVVGEVVKLRRKMQWFDNRPLTGKSIVVTRARAQSSGLIEKLSEMGSECIECPTIKVVPPKSWDLVDNFIESINLYSWLVFTSVNGVDFFFKRVFEKEKDVRIFSESKFAVIGPATKKRLLNFGLRSDILPKDYYAESVLEEFKKERILNKKIGLIRAKDARMSLPDGLSKMGALVDEIPVYCTVKSGTRVDNVLSRLREGSIDMITFTSSSTVKNFKEMFFPGQLDSLLRGVSIAAIGPITADTASRSGFKVNLVASKYTIDNLCKSILNYYA